MRRGEENREKERKRKGGGRKERKGGRKEGVRWREGDGDLPPPPCVSVSLHPWAKGGRIKKEEGKKEKGRKERKRKERKKEEGREGGSLSNTECCAYRADVFLVALCSLHLRGHRCWGSFCKVFFVQHLQSTAYTYKLDLITQQLILLVVLLGKHTQHRRDRKDLRK